MTLPRPQVMIDPNEPLVLPPLASIPDTPDVDDAAVIDPRHQHRIELMQLLFSYSFEPNASVPDVFAEQYQDQSDLREIIADLPEIDEAIKKVAPERPLADINKVDLAILRLVVFESRHKKVPKKVLIDEGIELAKEYGTESSPRFVNGALAELFGL